MLINNNNNNFFCANILENQAQWRDVQNQGINQYHNRKQCVSRERMDPASVTSEGILI